MRVIRAIFANLAELRIRVVKHVKTSLTSTWLHILNGAYHRCWSRGPNLKSSRYLMSIFIRVKCIVEVPKSVLSIA